MQFKITPRERRVIAGRYNDDGIPYFTIEAGGGFYNSETESGFGFSASMSEADANAIAALPHVLAEFVKLLEDLESQYGETWVRAKYPGAYDALKLARDGREAV